MKVVRIEHLEGAITEMGAGKSMSGPEHDRTLWNGATDRCISILRHYIEGNGLFQMTARGKRKVKK